MQEAFWKTKKNFFLDAADYLKDPGNLKALARFEHG